MTKFIGLVLLFILLTALTQIGGIVLIFTWMINKVWSLKWPFKFPTLFLVFYISSTALLVPPLAAIFGREPVVMTENIQPTMRLTNWLNRHYVRPSVNQVLKNAEKELAGSGIKINYLDGNFPFWDGFPLLPHLSHNDGKKLDISFIYLDNEKVTDKKKSNSGYGVFEPPKAGEHDQPKSCVAKGYWQYNYAQFLTLGSKHQWLVFSPSHTERLTNAILSDPAIQKIFIEPHLKQRLKLTDARVRFHGCQAVRHDDHIHLQVK